MENIQKTLDWNPNANLDQVATALVGQGNDYRLFAFEGVGVLGGDSACRGRVGVEVFR